ncbi:MAG: Zn-ribbon domain-containing OB-fold protein [Syntrophales bacterium]|jgi:uncharacterized OB-fold protein|nr:Zn-ribbon domain-containing OB-fold protein [Syntrophales bacterium]MDY0044012.1 Zn-ribbon domain-containing OB-fold protein [Syntrophales bacterium]
MTLPEKPLPGINADTKFFWEGCKSQTLTFQKCEQCGYVRWPPSFICPECHSKRTELIKSSGKGKVYSFIVYHRAFHPAFERELPYVVAIVELAEGPHLLTNIIECRPSDIKCDMPVEVVFEKRSEEVNLPLFRPSFPK